MSKKQESNKSLKTDGPSKDSVSLNRRQFTKTGLLAPPVLMAVVSRPVFGVGCLSNILSGNLSEPDRGECNLGLSPGYWKNHPSAWPMGPASYKLDASIPHNCQDCDGDTGWACSGGPLFNDYFTTRTDSLNRSMHEIICTESNDYMFHIIAALLNAITDSNYVLSVTQVKDLWADPTLGGQINEALNEFLDKTWT